MKLSLLASGVVLAVAAIGTPAQAQNYPWCGHIDAGHDDSVNCGFVSFEQCMATIHGMGGFCMLNNQYQGPVAPAHPRHRASKHYSHRPS